MRFILYIDSHIECSKYILSHISRKGRGTLTEILRIEGTTMKRQFCITAIVCKRKNDWSADGSTSKVISMADNMPPVVSDHRPSYISLRSKYQAVLDKIQSLVDECKHNFKYYY